MKNYIDLIAKAIERISERKHLLTAVSSLESDGLEVVREGSLEHLCENVPSLPDQTRFVCDSTFTCPNNFRCAITRSVIAYSNCGGGNDSYECHDNDGFSCSSGGVNNADYFSCSAFDCGISGGTTSYTCSNIDFLCGGSDYNCVKDFKCTAGHVFFCSQADNCQDDFQCSAGTQCGQQGAATNSCVAGGPIVGYNNPSGGTMPGDFLCGAAIPDGSETFNCDINFECNALSDFSCAFGGNEFDCTGSSSDFGSFDCSSTFACSSNFSCLMVVSCGNTPTSENYVCPIVASYNRQPQG
jgi:hypothetical protein